MTDILRLCPPARLDWSHAGLPVSRDFGDIYFSQDGAIEESRAVFLGGCHLPESWQGHTHFTVAELGFGTGLNFLTCWDLWQRMKPKGARLSYIGIEKYPLSARQLRRIYSLWPAFTLLSQALLQHWPGRVQGIHRRHFGDVCLTLIHEDIWQAVAEVEGEVDGWFLDGFNPEKNPHMWSSALCRALAVKSASGARLASFSVAGAVREALQGAGFEVTRQPGFGRKRHRLEARFRGEKRPRALPGCIRPAIIGAGIAGQSLFHSFARRGITADIFADSSPAASGNALALVKPRLNRLDMPQSRFFLASYLYALAFYDEFTGVVRARGIRQKPVSEAQRQRFMIWASQKVLPHAHLHYHPGLDTLIFPQARIIAPPRLLKAGPQIRYGRITGIHDHRLHFTNQYLSAPYSHIFLAAGYGLKTLLSKASLTQARLRFSRGQISWAEPHPRLAHAVSYGGFALPLEETTMLGATHQRLSDTEDPFICHAEDDVANFAQFAHIHNYELTPARQASRASVRVNMADTLPLMSELGDGVWVLSGLGSRGFVYGPLLAEALVSQVLGEPLPVQQSLKALLALR